MSFNMWSVAENKLRCNKCPIFHSFQAPKKEKFFFSFFHFEKVLKAVARHLNWVLPSTWRRAIRTNGSCCSGTLATDSVSIFLMTQDPKMDHFSYQ